MTTSLLKDFIGGGLASARPVAATLGPTIPTGMSAYYFSTDTNVLSQLAGGDVVWQVATGGGGGGSGVPAGTSFPGTPASGDQFFRTDRGLYYFYDGTNWLTTEVFSSLFDPTSLIQLPLPYGGTYSLYLIGLDVSGSANSGTNSTNYPSYSLHAYNGTTTVDTTVATITGVAWSPNIWNHTTTTPNIVVASTYDILYITKAYVGGSSSITSDRMSARFRLVG